MRALPDSSHARRSLLAAPSQDLQVRFLYLGVSFALHILVFAGLIAMQSYSSGKVVPPSIQVNLVSFSSAPAQAAPAAREPVRAKVPEKEEPAVQAPVRESAPEPVSAALDLPEPARTVILPSKEKKNKTEPEESPADTVPEKKKSLKSKTFKPAKVLDNARKAIAETVEKERKDALEEALSRLERQVAKQTPANPGRAGIAVASAADTGGGNRDASAIDMYNIELMYRIQQNWAFNERLAGADKDIQVRILIKIMKNGELRDIWFETRSGNRYLDDSALKAIKKASPMPALPQGYSSYDVGLIFTPSGLK